MLFAETNPDPATAWNVVLTLGVLANLAVAVLALARSDRKQRREVSFELAHASKEEFDRHVALNNQVHDQIFSKIGGVERALSQSFQSEIHALRDERREDVGEITQSLKENGERLAAVETEATITNQRIAEMNAKLDRVIERRGDR